MTTTNITLTPEEIIAIEAMRAKKAEEMKIAEDKDYKEKQYAIKSAEEKIDDDIRKIQKINKILIDFYDKTPNGLFKIEHIDTEVKETPSFYKSGASFERIILPEMSKTTKKTKVTYIKYNIEVNVDSYNMAIVLSGSENNWKTTYYQKPISWINRVNSIQEEKIRKENKENKEISDLKKAMEFAKSQYPNCSIRSEGFKDERYIKIGKMNDNWMQYSVSFSYNVTNDNVTLTPTGQATLPSEKSKELQNIKNKFLDEYLQSIK